MGLHSSVCTALYVGGRTEASWCGPCCRVCMKGWPCGLFATCSTAAACQQWCRPSCPNPPSLRPALWALQRRVEQTASRLRVVRAPAPEWRRCPSPRLWPRPRVPRPPRIAERKGTCAVGGALSPASGLVPLAAEAWVNAQFLLRSLFPSCCFQSSPRPGGCGQPIRPPPPTRAAAFCAPGGCGCAGHTAHPHAPAAR